MTTPKASWTTSSAMAEWAEEVSNLLLREKSNAQNCLRDCERLLQDPNLIQSDSLKEGLKELRSKTEDSYGTLLHLERVLNMKNLGDFPAKSKAQNTESNSSLSQPSSEPVSMATSAVTKTGRFRQQGIRSVDFASAASGAQGDINELDDPLSDELMFANEPPEHRQHEEIDDFDDDSGFPEAAPAYKRKDLQVENPMMMAKSLPMNVPMPRMMLGRSPPDLDEDTSDIPKKIAELAKSLHVDSIGELPSPRLIE